MVPAVICLSSQIDCFPISVDLLDVFNLWPKLSLTFHTALWGFGKVASNVFGKFL